MKTEKIVLSDLFEKPRRYLIPIFQRGYVWTKDEQWAPLWEDIINLVDAIRLQREVNPRNMRKHFLGALVLQQQNLGVRHVPVSDVIDGQQRLITLQLILIALRDTVTSLSNDFLNATLERLTQNPGPYINEDERFKVWPTSVYRDDFGVLATAGSIQSVEEKFPLIRQRRKYLPRPQLVEAYIFFCKKIEECLNNNNVQLNDSEQSDLGDRPVEVKVQLAEGLLEAITRHIQLVEINLDTEDDPQIIFETLNARGAPLTASDLIRNYVFLYASRSQDDVVRLYERYWKPFDETPDDNARSKTRRFWKEEERQGRFKTNRLDLFFYHYLTCQTEADLKIGHIFQEFKDWWDHSTEPRVTSTELSKLLAMSEIYRRLITLRNGSKFGQLSSVLRMLDTTTVYPVILYLESMRDEIGDENIDGIYEDIESYLIRRVICGLTPKNYNKLFLSFLQFLKTQTALTRSVAQKYLLSLEGDSGRWADDEEFKQHFVHDPIYEKLRSVRIQYILESIERGLATNFQESIEVNTDLSIEHVWPQNPAGEEWPPVEKNEDGTINWTLWIKRRSLINSIGNLTLVTPSFNSSLSNRSFSVKKPAIIRESRLRINTYFQTVVDVWTEEDIIQRANALFNIAKKLWVHPGS
jgi:uncharacterized protein with ParB-like and HNH nuclease domain